MKLYHQTSHREADVILEKGFPEGEQIALTDVPPAFLRSPEPEPSPAHATDPPDAAPEAPEHRDTTEGAKEEDHTAVADSAEGVPQEGPAGSERLEGADEGEEHPSDATDPSDEPAGDRASSEVVSQAEGDQAGADHSGESRQAGDAMILIDVPEDVVKPFELDSEADTSFRQFLVPAGELGASSIIAVRRVRTGADGASAGSSSPESSDATNGSARATPAGASQTRSAPLLGVVGLLVLALLAAGAGYGIGRLGPTGAPPAPARAGAKPPPGEPAAAGPERRRYEEGLEAGRRAGFGDAYRTSYRDASGGGE